MASAPPLNAHGIRELEAIGQERSPELFHASLLSFTDRLIADRNFPAAYQLLQNLSAIGDLDANLSALVRRRLESLQGKGGFGDSAETILGQLAASASDYRNLVPMLAGTVIYQTSRSLGMGRLTASALEIPAFTFLQRNLRQNTGAAPLSSDLLKNSLSLGMMKVRRVWRRANSKTI